LRDEGNPVPAAEPVPLGLPSDSTGAVCWLPVPVLTLCGARPPVPTTRIWPADPLLYAPVCVLEMSKRMTLSRSKSDESTAAVDDSTSTGNCGCRGREG